MFWVKLPKISAYRTDLDEAINVSYLIKNDKFLKKYNEVWDKVSNTIEKDLIGNLFTMKNI